MAQIAQTAVCHRHHSVEEQLSQVLPCGAQHHRGQGPPDERGAGGLRHGAQDPFQLQRLTGVENMVLSQLDARHA